MCLQLGNTVLDDSIGRSPLLSTSQLFTPPLPHPTPRHTKGTWSSNMYIPSVFHSVSRSLSDYCRRTAKDKCHLLGDSSFKPPNPKLEFSMVPQTQQHVLRCHADGPPTRAPERPFQVKKTYPAISCYLKQMSPCACW